MNSVFSIFKKFIFLLLLLGASTRLSAVTSDEYYRSGLSLYGQKQFAQSADYFKAAVQTDAQNWKAYHALGNAYYRMNRTSDALEAFRRSLALHDDPDLRKFADSIQVPATPSLPGLPPTGSVAAPPLPGSEASPSPSSNQPLSEREALADYYSGKELMEKGKNALKLSGEDLSEDGRYILKYGAPRSSFLDPHVTLEFGFLTPTFIDIDLGFQLDPTTNLGLSGLDIPVTDGNYIFLEARIKYFNKPGGLDTYDGFGLAILSLSRPADAYYYNTSFFIIAPSYKFGFRTLPMDGMTMELGLSMGVALLLANEETYDYNTSTYGSATKAIPFPFIYPEMRFGFTF